MTLLRWFFSKTVREATSLRRHVWKLVQAQRDLLAAEGIAAIQLAINSLQSKIKDGASKGAIRLAMEELEFTANKWLKPYPHSGWRENIEVVLVALAVAMGVRTFFLQPFKIPTGSMQPTLWGVTSENLRGRPVEIPKGLERLRQWAAGISYLHVTAARDGALEEVAPPVRLLIFSLWQRIRIGGEWQTIWLPPDFGSQTLEQRAELRLGTRYAKGQDVAKIKVKCGDHLFVNRVTYNFRRPQRGEIVVFKTAGTDIPQQDQFYIKRMVAMGDEKVRVGDDRHLRINGQRLDRDTPHFELVYSFDPNKPPAVDHYSGHVNNLVARKYGYISAQQSIAPLFENGEEERLVPPRSYMVMGDNTLMSFDSRAWGSFSERNIIGKSSFVYWPLSDRWGLGYR